MKLKRGTTGGGTKQKTEVRQDAQGTSRPLIVTTTWYLDEIRGSLEKMWVGKNANPPGVRGRGWRKTGSEERAGGQRQEDP